MGFIINRLSSARQGIRNKTKAASTALSNGRKRLLTKANQTAAKVGNFGVGLTSQIYRGQLRKMLLESQEKPRWLVSAPEEVEQQATRILSPKLQHAIFRLIVEKLKIKDSAEQERYRPKQEDIKEIMKAINEGISSEIFDSYGNEIYINADRVGHLLYRLAHLLVFTKAKIDIASMKPEEFNNLKDSFTKLAVKRKIVRQYYYGELIDSSDGEARDLGRGYYTESLYTIKNRDGGKNVLTRTINQGRVNTDDDSPSVLLVPGTASTSGMFDLDNETSLRLGLADKGNWVYSFDHRNMGQNNRPTQFDHTCSIDTLVSNDLPAALHVVSERPTIPKPVIMIGHSLGGLLSLGTLVRQAYKLDHRLAAISEKLSLKYYPVEGKSTTEIETSITEMEQTISTCKMDNTVREEVESLLAKAKTHLQMLKATKGVITLGTPLRFFKDSDIIFPTLLSLGVLQPATRQTKVNVGLVKAAAPYIPGLTFPVRHLINSKNFSDPQEFVKKLVIKGTDSFPNAVGYQMLKAIAKGGSLERLDKSGFKYWAHLNLIPTDIPIINIIGEQDPLAPPKSVAIFDKEINEGNMPPTSDFKQYMHKIQRTVRLEPGITLAQLGIESEKSQVINVIVPGVRHLDMFYGKTAKELVLPTIHEAKTLIWEA